MGPWNEDRPPHTVTVSLVQTVFLREKVWQCFEVTQRLRKDPISLSFCYNIPCFEFTVLYIVLLSSKPSQFWRIVKGFVWPRNNQITFIKYPYRLKWSTNKDWNPSNVTEDSPSSVDCGIKREEILQRHYDKSSYI